MLRVLVLVFMALTVTVAQQQSGKQRHWELTDNETLWVGRYSNCQYDYYLLLPTSAVAHGEHPPAPHHGFLVSLPNSSLRTEVTFDNSARYVWVNGEYNATEKSTLSGVTDYQIDLTRGNGKNFRVIERRSLELQSVPAQRFKAEYFSPKGRAIEEIVVVLRSGVVYQLGLKTSPQDYSEDRERFERFLGGMRFTRMPNGQCWND